MKFGESDKCGSVIEVEGHEIRQVIQVPLGSRWVNRTSLAASLSENAAVPFAQHDAPAET